MSRSICITVKFNNGRTRKYGVYNPTNAEYEKSRLPYEGMIACLEKAKKACKGMKLKNISVTNQISTGSSKEHWETLVSSYPTLAAINPCKLVDLNDVLYKGALKL